MYIPELLLLLALLGALDASKVAYGEPAAGSCKCGPNDECWPSELTWATLNQSVDNRLIKTEPVAKSCYPGQNFNSTECSHVTQLWSDQDFQTSNPIGRPYPYNITCAPVNYTSGETPTTCTLGISPRYAVNATTRDHILSTVLFARLNNIRLVVVSTGHDLLGRSDGYGSLELWLRHYRNGIDFQKLFASICTCTKSGWTGSAIRIDGAWQWRDVNKVAKANDVIVVGGGSYTPGAIGGWPSGGGHGPATRNYGLGADQILEAEILLADGSTVIANHCENTDLFKAIRGGGPGYGVMSATVKAYPNVEVITAHRLVIAPLTQTADNSVLLDAVSLMLQSYADLNDAGFSGYAFWFRNYPTVYVANATSGYRHGIWTIGKSQTEAEAAFSPFKTQLQSKFNTTLFINESYASYKDYWSFYESESGTYDPAGVTSIMTSRLIDRDAVSNHTKVRQTVEVISGAPEEYTNNVVGLVSGGQVFKDAADKTSGLNPAWRRSHFAVITARGVPMTVSNVVRQSVQDDITHVKEAAWKALAPNTGGYMNEGNRHDPDYRQSFYGSQYADHLATKRRYDPFNVFYCATCVGSEAFVERPDAPLCAVVSRE